MAATDSLPFVSLDVSHILRKWLDLPYATVSPAQKLDLYLPERGAAPFPVLLYIHGGGFELGDKRDAPLRPFLTGLDRGYAVVSVNYRLSSEAVFPAAVQDVKAAVRWLRGQGDSYGLDVRRVAACGDSAGGYLAVMLGVTHRVSIFDDPALGHPDQSSEVQAVVDWFGPVDFSTMQEQLRANALPLPPDFPEVRVPVAASLRTFEDRFLGVATAQAPELAKAASPITYLHPNIPPLLIQHGDVDPLVPVQQSEQLARAIEESAGLDACELDILSGAGHGGPHFETNENMDRVFAFLDKALGMRQLPGR